MIGFMAPCRSTFLNPITCDKLVVQDRHLYPSHIVMNVYNARPPFEKTERCMD